MTAPLPQVGDKFKARIVLDTDRINATEEPGRALLLLLAGRRFEVMEVYRYAGEESWLFGWVETFPDIASAVEFFLEKVGEER